MIAKRIDMRDASKSRATVLAKYVTTDLERAGRVAEVFTANCISNDALLAAKEIEICQAKNTRAKDDKTYHLLLSFPDGERPDIRVRYKSLGYIEWLKREAERGSIPAILVLRKRGAVAPALVNITARDLRNAKLIAAKIAHVTGRGTLFYRAGADVLRDNGSHISLKRDVSDAGIEAALQIAVVKFNCQPLSVNGTDEFKERCINVAARVNLPIVFSDIQLEKARQEWSHPVSLVCVRTLAKKQKTGNIPQVETMEPAKLRRETKRDIAR